MADFTDFGALQQLSSRILVDVDAYSRWQNKEDERRTHLGASEIGDDCWRRLWGNFRWLKVQTFPGRMLRLFRRGHDEEANFIELLRGIGFNVMDVDTSTGKQWRIIGVGGHAGGSQDSRATLPARYNFPNEPILCEFKTHNKNSFGHVKKKGVIIGKPRHFAQMSMYGFKSQIRIGLYCAVCKDDDDLHFEFVPLDWHLGKDAERKAEEIITAKMPTNRISENPAHFECQHCHLSGICFEGERPEKNCRSCKMAVPVEDAKWYCENFRQHIPPEFIAQGCNEWKAIING